MSTTIHRITNYGTSLPFQIVAVAIFISLFYRFLLFNSFVQKSHAMNYFLKPNLIFVAKKFVLWFNQYKLNCTIRLDFGLDSRLDSGLDPGLDFIKRS